jgi:Ca2+-binding RTX toxin-like protein
MLYYSSSLSSVPSIPSFGYGSTPYSYYGGGTETYDVPVPLPPDRPVPFPPERPRSLEIQGPPPAPPQNRDYFEGFSSSSLYNSITGLSDSIVPVVLDLNNDGVDIIPQNESTAYFDIDGDGFRQKTAWAGSTDGFLVLDLAADGNAGADGQISQGKELAFGLWTTNPSDTDAEALLAIFDTNHDLSLNAGDARWNEFRIWKDTNSNGISDTGEVVSLANYDIYSIGLTTDKRASLLPDSSKINGFGYAYTTTGTGMMTYADIGLAHNREGFRRDAKSYGFDYVTQQGTGMPLTQVFYDTRTLGTYNTSQNVHLNGNGGITADGYLGSRYNDFFMAHGTKAVTLVGDLGNDSLEGGNGSDVLDGGAGTDVIHGFGGDDTLYIDSNDYSAASGITFDGGWDYDTAILTSTFAYIFTLSDRSIEAFISNAGNDTLYSGISWTGTFIDGRAGNDVITGNNKDDILVGGVGNDTIYGHEGNDLVNGGSGVDTLYGYEGDDSMLGGDSNDYVYGHAGNDTLNGGEGNDYMTGSAGGDVLNGGNGDDQLWGDNDTPGAGFVDLLYGNDGNDTLWGGEKDDWLGGGRGADLLYGEDGFDYAVYEDAGSMVTVSLTAPASNYGRKGVAFDNDNFLCKKVPHAS